MDKKNVVRKNAVIFITLIIFTFTLVSCSDWLVPGEDPEDIIPSMVLVEGGTFMMGTDDVGGTLPKDCPVGKPDRFSSPAHQVTLTYDFYMSTHLITFDEFSAYCEEKGITPPNDIDARSGKSMGKGSRPVLNLTFKDTIRYCNFRSEKEGFPKAYKIDTGQLLDAAGNVTIDLTKVEGYRLPTEAEWEFAAKGGNKSKGYLYSGSNDIDEVAWYWRNSGDATLTGDYDSDYFRTNENSCVTHPVEEKKPNELGIYDMSGNVLERCTDWYQEYGHSSHTSQPINPYIYSGVFVDSKSNPYVDAGTSERVMRGGAWDLEEIWTLVTQRHQGDPSVPFCHLGFRLVRKK